MRKYRAIEMGYPLVISIVLAGVYLGYSFLQGEPKLDSGQRREFLSMVVDVGAIAVGFIGAVMGIVLSIDDRLAIKHLRRSGTYSDLIDYLGWAALSSLFLVVYSLMIVGATVASIYLIQYPKLHATAAALWIFISVFSVLASYRALTFFWAVMKYREEDPSPELGSDPTK